MAQKNGLLILLPPLLLTALSFQGALAEQPAAVSQPVSQATPTPAPVNPPATPSATAAPSATSTPAATATPVPTATPTPAATPNPATPAPTTNRPVPPPAAQNLENLTPEQRKRFEANLDRWRKLPKVQQDELRREAEFHRKRIIQEINEAIEKTGLKLDEQQRQVFTYRYAQERRTLEEKLREEVDQKRQEAISELIWQLSAEFQPLPAESHQP